jgi:hypothetical protein
MIQRLGIGSLLPPSKYNTEFLFEQKGDMGFMCHPCKRPEAGHNCTVAGTVICIKMMGTKLERTRN